MLPLKFLGILFYLEQGNFIWIVDSIQKLPCENIKKVKREWIILSVFLFYVKKKHLFLSKNDPKTTMENIKKGQEWIIFSLCIKENTCSYLKMCAKWPWLHAHTRCLGGRGDFSLGISQQAKLIFPFYSTLRANARSLHLSHEIKTCYDLKQLKNHK